MEKTLVVTPTFNEADTIAAVIREIPAAYRLDIIVADSGSTDVATSWPAATSACSGGTASSGVPR